MTDGAALCVAICTFRRPNELRQLLEHLGRQRFAAVAPSELHLLVVDNAPEGGATDVVGSRCEPFSGVTHVHAGASNIAVARNAVLDHVPSGIRFVACIDDDELPEPEWLDELLRVQRSTAAPFVIGPVRPVLPTDAPGWLVEGRFYDLYELADGAALEEGLTGNALLDIDVVRRLGLRFDERLGLAGGEDQLFFRQAHAAGASIRFAAGAVVYEPVPAARTTVRYLLRREFRKGNTLGLFDRGAPGWPKGRPLRRAATALKWAGTGAVVGAGGLVGRDRARSVRGLLSASRAAGMVTGLIGHRFDSYRTTRRRPMLAFVVSEAPGVQSAGQGTYLEGMLRHCAASGYRVVVLVVGPRLGFLVRGPGAPYEIRSPASFVLGGRTVARPRAALRHLAWAAFRRAPRPVQRALDIARSRWRRSRAGIDHVLGVPLAGGRRSWVRAELAALEPAAVFYNSVFNVLAPEDQPVSALTSFVVTHDTVADRAERFRALGYRVHPADFDAASEGALLSRVPTLIAIQWEEAARLRELAPSSAVIVTAPTVDVERPVRRAPVPGRCIFVGSGSLHNVDGIKWFMAEVWPKVMAGVPGAELQVIGTVCARLGAAPEGVVLRGEVADLDDAYATSACAVVALRAGSGLKLKLVDALCHHVPVATTSVGAQGLLGDVDPPFLLADEPDDLADAVITILTDEHVAARLTRQAELGATRFTTPAAYRELDGALRAAGVESPSAVV